jgi:hypothetical protein
MIYPYYSTNNQMALGEDCVLFFVLLLIMIVISTASQTTHNTEMPAQSDAFP